jgi:hypothetical protein
MFYKLAKFGLSHINEHKTTFHETLSYAVCIYTQVRVHFHIHANKIIAMLMSKRIRRD